MPDQLFRTSQRMAAVQTPIIPLVSELIKKTPGTISLGQGVVYYGPPGSALARAKAIEESVDYHRYGDVDGLAILREQIQQKLEQENAIPANASRSIVVTAGANMAFLNALLAITDPGDEIILLKPYYFNHEMAITMLNCKAVVVSTDADFQPCLEKITEKITDKTKAIVTVSPNNPSGAVYTEDCLRQINTLCKNHQCYHISDEAYEYFTYDDAKHFSVASIKGSAQHTIALYSLSKAYGFASWRIGYMLLPRHLLMAVKKIQDTNLICPTRIAQEAALAALKEGRVYCEQHLSQIKSIRDELYAALQDISDICHVANTTGAFYFLAKLDTVLNRNRISRKINKKT